MSKFRLLKFTPAVRPSPLSTLDPRLQAAVTTTAALLAQIAREGVEYVESINNIMVGMVEELEKFEELQNPSDDYEGA